MTGHGGFDQLVLRADIPVPTPGPAEVLIKVSAAAVNNTDLNTRLGWYAKEGSEDTAGWSGDAMQFPRIQGADVCGTVVAKGEQVSADLMHRRVLVDPCLFEVHGKMLSQPWYFGSECDGAFAEYTCVAARHAHPVNSTLPAIELASFPCSYSTAENCLTRANVRASDRILITGASGGVGSAAVQLAKARGAKIVAITSSDKAEAVGMLGAQQIVERNANLLETLGANSIDVVIDLVGGAQWPQLLEVLKPFGRYATSGAIAGAFVELDLRTLYLKDISLLGCTVLGPEIFPNLIRRIEAGDIQALVAKTFKLEQLVEAQKAFETKQHVGKIVIDIATS